MRKQMMKPYVQFMKGNTIVRSFNETVDDIELIWHRDKKDRLVKIIEGKNWYLQMDNELPMMLKEDKEYYIPKQTFHRVIKGDSKLNIEIKEF